MSTDLLMPALDPNLPAELSPTIIDGVLRHVSASTASSSPTRSTWTASPTYSMNEAGVLAILAGCDSRRTERLAQMTGMINARKSRSPAGGYQARIDLSVRRILVLKMRMGLIPVPLSNLAPTPAIGSMQPVDGPGSTRASLPPSQPPVTSAVKPLP